MVVIVCAEFSWIHFYDDGAISGVSSLISVGVGARFFPQEAATPDSTLNFIRLRCGCCLIGIKTLHPHRLCQDKTIIDTDLLTRKSS